MRYILLTVLCLVFQFGVQAESNPKDSLLRALANTTDQKEQLRIYRNLADLTYETPEESGYLNPLYEKAIKLGQNELALETLSDLTQILVDREHEDSIRYCMDLIKELAPQGTQDRWLCYLNMYMIDMGTMTLEDKINSEKNKEQSIYSQIEDAYTIGVKLYDQRKPAESLPYMETAVNLSEKLPLKEGFKYQMRTMRLLAKLYTMNGQIVKSIPMLENVVRLQERYYNEYIRDSRPFYPINDFLIANYSSLLLNAGFMPEEKVQHYIKLLTKLGKESPSPKNRYNYFHALSNYYLGKKEYKAALQCNDSLIRYAHQIASYNVPGLYKLSSWLYERLDNPAQALSYLKKSIQMKDSLQSEEGLEKLKELQVQYEVSNLNYEKSKLEIRNKRIMVICLTVILALAVILCLYLYTNLKKERAMKQRLRILKVQAEESEKMKTAFINSICHEIRTPLNAIAGFTELMFDDSIDEESKACFPETIRQNTDLLTSLIDSMLEVSNLDVSDEKLPCEPADIAGICQREVDRFAEYASPEIEYRAELPESPLVIPTNAHYLALVIEHLLDNAKKFTERGSIVLRCVKEGDRLVLTVTDTGCGIPEKMRETVFDRFTKLDTYKPGNGLGLYMCRLVVNRLSGEISIDPDYKEGTRMTIILPIG